MGSKRKKSTVLPLDFAEIKRIAIVAMFSDNVLMNQLVLKGGNALDLVHQISSRGSADIDFSMPGQFMDVEDTKRRIFKALYDRFDSANYIVFDQKFKEKPPFVTADRKDWWGGYSVEFKIINKEKYQRLRDNLEAMRRESQVVGPEQLRTFSIDISKHEFCDQKLKQNLDDYIIYVYSLEMIAIEKIRAICQQMPEYDTVDNKRARARDFYDVCQIFDKRPIEFGTSENMELFKVIFSAKNVPLYLLGNVGKKEFREFHRQDWPLVRQTVIGELREFDFYFDRVVKALEPLKSLWEK
jgi:predicted nucleotidyltransferase component of viral defense system